LYEVSLPGCKSVLYLQQETWDKFVKENLVSTKSYILPELHNIRHMLKTKVKASAITNLTDARYFAAWEVEWLGFNFNLGDDSYIAPQEMKAIKEWVDGVKVVGEFGLQSVENIIDAVQLLELDAVQLGAFSSTTDLQMLHQQGITLLKEVVITEQAEWPAIEQLLEEQSTFVEYFLLDFSKNGMDWENMDAAAVGQVQALSKKYPILISIGGSASAMEEMLDTTAVEGISVQGGAEEKVGFKSFDELDDLFDVLAILE
jgi:phosphoribosylanthranilate isomerase